MVKSIIKKAFTVSSAARKSTVKNKENNYPSELNLILVAVAQPNFPESKNRIEVSCNTSVHHHLLKRTLSKPANDRIGDISNPRLLGQQGLGKTAN